MFHFVPLAARLGSDFTLRWRKIGCSVLRAVPGMFGPEMAHAALQEKACSTGPSGRCLYAMWKEKR